MPKRTTVVLDDDVYEKLVRLLYSEKLAEASVGELNNFRRRLSKRLAER
ncbi:hypothetical protein [Staphylothermus hellenicus]|uniref:Uncharacterized protein n=1 Tax=Staphylothermus hellenicus (strain DSM 12710 / JCM 10830 / BK20S6-10-b1 / P8) TaxID=591019 RepID=D7D8C6_STAHD|nr:hypothetical protein [Staphylothermus hellenicus]ADI32022.1 hypothetical protein Shell_0914 [Staphylothermus hellenicus DSM 12710]